MAAGQVAVVGAGLAGLSAAVELQQRGYEVEVFEGSRLIGGKASSFTVDGTEVDTGQHVLLGCCSELIDFVRGLGMGDTLRIQRRFEVLLLRPGAEACRLRANGMPSPLHLLPVLIGHRHLDWPARLQVARAIAQARWGVARDESLGDWLDRCGQGERARRFFWEPFLVPALNAGLDEASASAGRFIITTAFAGSREAACIGLAAVPLARIAEAAAARVSRVHLRRPVTGLRLNCRGAVSGVQLADGCERAFDCVVLAVPPRALCRLLGDPARFGVQGLDAFRTEAIVDVHLWYEEADLGFDFAALVESPVQWVFQKAPGYLCCSLSAANGLAQWRRAEIIDLCLSQLGAALPALAGRSPLRALVTRDPEATFVPTPGLRRPGPGTLDPNLAIAGAWTDTGWPATMESAVRSGRAAARWLDNQKTRHAA